MLALDEFFDGPTVDGAENDSLKSEDTGSGKAKKGLHSRGILLSRSDNE
jgi:hypothetical protein